MRGESFLFFFCKKKCQNHTKNKITKKKLQNRLKCIHFKFVHTNLKNLRKVRKILRGCTMVRSWHLETLLGQHYFCLHYAPVIYGSTSKGKDIFHCSFSQLGDSMRKHREKNTLFCLIFDQKSFFFYILVIKSYFKLNFGYFWPFKKKKG